MFWIGLIALVANRGAADSLGPGSESVRSATSRSAPCRIRDITWASRSRRLRSSKGRSSAKAGSSGVSFGFGLSGIVQKGDLVSIASGRTASPGATSITTIVPRCRNAFATHWQPKRRSSASPALFWETASSRPADNRWKTDLVSKTTPVKATSSVAPSGFGSSFHSVPGGIWTTRRVYSPCSPDRTVRVWAPALNAAQTKAQTRTSFPIMQPPV